MSTPAKEREFFVTEQEKIFYELGRKLGGIPSVELQKAFLQKLQKELSSFVAPHHKSSNELTKNILHNALLKDFASSALEENIENAANKSLHSNRTAFFKGFEEASAESKEKPIIASNSRR